MVIGGEWFPRLRLSVAPLHGEERVSDRTLNRAPNPRRNPNHLNPLPSASSKCSIGPLLEKEGGR
jgi:hypothetical protein